VPLSLTLRVARSALTRPRTVRYGTDRNQVAELWLPDGAGPFPVAVLLHGGFWRTQYGKLTCRPLAARLRSRGFAVWNLEYRRVGPGRRGGGGWPATFLDVAAGVDALADLDVPLDLGALTLFGHSAGGQLALWAALRGELPDGAVGAKPRVRSARVVGLSPVTDLVAAGEAGVALMGGSCAQHPERWQQADPLRAGTPSCPVLVVHPDGDETIPVARSRTYVEYRRGQGWNVELSSPPGEGHRHVILPTSASWAAVEQWLGLPRLRPNR
jgi:acetyl esterase/lipase